MRINSVRKAAIGLAMVAGSVGLSMTAPVAAHALESTPTVQTVDATTVYDSGSLSGTADGGTLSVKKTQTGVIVNDAGGGCTKYTYFYSDGSMKIVYRCLIIVQA
jgi:hypothetical protein